MEDELVTLWDTFWKKMRMNFLWIGAGKTYQTSSSDFIGLGTSLEPEALSGPEP